MTESTGDGAADLRPGTGVAVPSRGRVAAIVLGAAFWSWLVVHWVYRNPVLDGALTALGVGGVLRSEVNVRDREPFLSPEPIDGAARFLTDVAEMLGPVGVPVGWLAWVVDTAAVTVESIPALAAGAWFTVLLTVASILLGLLIAVPLAVGRVYGGSVVGAVALGYTELIRGTPLLAQLFVLFFGLPLQGFFDDIPGVGGVLPSAPVLVAIVGFTINSSAYQAEYIRGALESVDSGQLTAARAVGLSRTTSIRHVVLPQGLRFAIPGWTNEFVYLIKYSSLAAFITVPELFQQAGRIGSDTLQTTQLLLIAGLFYLGMVLTATAVMERFESRVAIPGLDQDGG